MKGFLGILMCVATVLVHVAAADSGPKSIQAETEAMVEAAEKALEVANPQAYVSDKILNFFRPKEKEVVVEEEAVETFTPPAPRRRAVVKPGYVPAAPPRTPPPQTQQIRQEIQSILALNQKIKNIQGDRVQQLQRIQEQARLHQKVLDQIDAESAESERAATAKEALLAQEKLRIIHDEAKRSQELLSAVANEEEGAAAPSPRDTLEFTPIFQDESTSEN